MIAKIESIPRRVLYTAQRSICYLCGKGMNNMTTATKDHIVPRSLGGRGGANLLLTHRDCNTRRGSKPLTLEQQVRARYQKLAVVAFLLSMEKKERNGAISWRKLNGKG